MLEIRIFLIQCFQREEKLFCFSYYCRVNYFERKCAAMTIKKIEVDIKTNLYLCHVEIVVCEVQRFKANKIDERGDMS